jgi:hypothetical protein
MEIEGLGVPVKVRKIPVGNLGLAVEKPHDLDLERAGRKAFAMNEAGERAW